jgi:hypothetical protein
MTNPKLEVLTPQNSQIKVTDHQPQMAFDVQSIDRQTLKNNVVALAKAAKVFKIPTTIMPLDARAYVSIVVMAMVGTSLLPTSVEATWNGTDQMQCADTYVDGGDTPKWVYGGITRFRPEARPSAEKVCNAKASNCVYIGCFRRK